MSAAIPLRDDCDAYELRVLAGRVKDANQARRLLAVAAVYEGMDREEAARIGGMDRQTLRDWVHRFNTYGPDGLINIKPPGRPPRLSAEQREELRELVEAGPDPQTDGVARWRCVDLKRVLGKRFGVDLSEVRLGRIRCNQASRCACIPLAQSRARFSVRMRNGIPITLRTKNSAAQIGIPSASGTMTSSAVTRT
jgi:transposase